MNTVSDGNAGSQLLRRGVVGVDTTSVKGKTLVWVEVELEALQVEDYTIAKRLRKRRDRKS